MVWAAELGLWSGRVGQLFARKHGMHELACRRRLMPGWIGDPKFRQPLNVPIIMLRDGAHPDSMPSGVVVPRHRQTDSEG